MEVQSRESVSRMPKHAREREGSRIQARGRRRSQDDMVVRFRGRGIWNVSRPDLKESGVNANVSGRLGGVTDAFLYAPKAMNRNPL